MTYVRYGAVVATAFGLGMALAVSLKFLPERSTARSTTELLAAEASSAAESASRPLDLGLTLYQAADEFDQQASASAEKAKTETDSVVRSQSLRQARVYWQQALKKLSDIPTDSALSERATLKQSVYSKRLAAAVRDTTALQKTFIADTLIDVGIDPAQIHITLCQLADSENLSSANGLSPEQCQQHLGDQLLASPASLIKLPIAIALVEKANTDNIPLTTKILVSEDNYTENAEGESLEVGREYSLQEIMSQMIKRSDNIATNQLIDYLGYDTINQALSRYSQTSVGHKLIGSEIAPTYFGDGINQSTTDDLTAMMATVYTQGDNQPIRTALAGQQDQELGYSALQGIGLQVAWLGEKTGQNDLLIGTTLAMKVHRDTYLLTVAIDNSGDVFILQQVIGRIAKHLSLNGSLMGP